jgi:ABC-2 type transport system permease protein
VSVLRQIAALACRECIILSRQRIAFTLLVLVPVIQVLLYGYAIRPTASDLRVAVAGPGGATQEEVAKILSREPGLKVAAGALPMGEAEAMVRERRADIGIELPEAKSFADPFAKGGPARVIADGADVALTAAAVPALEAAFWREIVSRSDMAESGHSIAVVRLHNPDRRSDWTFLPGLVGVIIMIGMTMLGSLSLARDRESGRAEALTMFPCPGWAMLAGKLLPWLVVGSLQGGAVLAIGTVLFGLPLAGSAGAMLVLIPLLALAHLALGQLISLRSASQLEALQGVVAFYLPAMLLSGFLYPFQALPGWAQVIGNLFPLSHFIRAAQGATLRSEPVWDVLAYGWPIALFTAVVAVLSVWMQARGRAV